MIEQMNLVVQFLFNCLDSIVTVYMVNGVLTMVFAVYVIRKLSKLLDHIR